MTYEEKYDAVQVFCDKYESLIDEAPEGSDMWAFKRLDDTMMDIESVLCDDWIMLGQSSIDILNNAKSKITDTMLHIAEKWSNENLSARAPLITELMHKCRRREIMTTSEIEEEGK